MKGELKALLRTLLIITPVTIVNACCFVWLYVTNDIAIGGATGIAQIINRLFGFLPLGALIIVINFPLFVLGWKKLDRRILLLCLYTMLVNSLSVDLINSLVTFEPMEPLLACIYGGLSMGVSTGLILQQGASSGGTDLAARLLKLKFGWLPIGRLILIVNLVILSLAALAYQNMDTLLYGLIALYASSIATDGVIYGLDKSQVAYIISDRYSLIACEVIQNLHRGVTLLEGHGAWSGEEKQVIMLAFKKRQIITVKEMVKKIDPQAFMIVCPAYEVLGEGFHVYRKNDL